MINYVDIVYSISNLLKSFGYKTYIDENRDKIKTPSFCINLRPVNTTNRRDYKEKSVNVDIMYFGKNPSNEDFLKVTEQLEDIFNLTLKVKDRVLTINELDIRIVDDILHFAFTLDYSTAIEKIETFKPMQNLEMGGF